jgi:predicted Abi (CAAX) family protease
MNKTISRILGLLLSIGVVALITLLFTPDPPVDSTSDYALTSRLAVNQPGYFPIQQTLDPELYRPLARWVGRLILPDSEALRSNPVPAEDWAWLEIYQAPSERSNLVGEKVRLSWQRSPSLERYLKLVTTDIKLTPAARKSERQGNVIPVRLDGRSRVGPLQALAGARPKDDVLVSFNEAQVTEAKPTNLSTDISRFGSSLQTRILIDRMPTLVTGRFLGLVKILGEAPARSPADIPTVCPGSPPCPSELTRVKHYHRATGEFDGLEEVIRIPQQPLVSGDRFISTPRQLAESPEGKAGWYIYGARGQDGFFTVQALRPRSLFQLKPMETVSGLGSSLNYIASGNWKNTPERGGTAQRVVVDFPGERAEWKEGDRGLGIHLFGGIGGKKAESLKAGTVTGHYSYFVYQVVRDPFTEELQWDITYDQVYAHNPQGILSGSQSWANYTGNLQRGWLNSRPISDVIVKLEVLRDYNLGGVLLSPLTEFQRQLEIMMARYRTGDGTGSSNVTPAVSCVQDSNQALYITIEVLRNRIQTNAAIADWVKNHPDDPEARRFQRLGQLGDRLKQVLAPRGIIRPDWQQNAKILAAVESRQGASFTRQDTLANALLSWQSMLPRVSHDVISRIFLEQGATLWFLRTNQVGGSMPEILPLAPTNLFGEVPVLSLALRRVLASIVLLPTLREGGITVIAVLLYGAIALPIGIRSGFLQWRASERRPFRVITTLFFLFLSPALWEELVFRVLLLPHPDGLNSPAITFGMAVLSLALFVIYHPINALVFYPAGKPTFFHPVFLGLTALLGLTCTVVYWLTGSLWTIAIVHWIVVAVWLLGLNGLSKFTREKQRERKV